MIPVEEARSLIRALARPVTGADRVPLADALGRVLVEPVDAERDDPPFARSMMDGYAVRSDEIGEPPWRLEVVGRVAAGDPDPRAVRPGRAAGGGVPHSRHLRLPPTGVKRSVAGHRAGPTDAAPQSTVHIVTRNQKPPAMRPPSARPNPSSGSRDDVIFSRHQPDSRTAAAGSSSAGAPNPAPIRS